MTISKKIVLVITCFMFLSLLITAFVLYRRSPYTYVKEDKIINYALMGSQSDFELLCSSCSESDKLVEYEITIQSGKEKTDQFFTIANRVNDYLETHPDYFLNEGYKITVSIVMNRSGAPEIVKFSNWNWDCLRKIPPGFAYMLFRAVFPLSTPLPAREHLLNRSFSLIVGIHSLNTEICLLTGTALRKGRSHYLCASKVVSNFSFAPKIK